MQFVCVMLRWYARGLRDIVEEIVAGGILSGPTSAHQTANRVSGPNSRVGASGKPGAVQSAGNQPPGIPLISNNFSDNQPDRRSSDSPACNRSASDQSDQSSPTLAGCEIRLSHKLMEEVLTGEVASIMTALSARAVVLRGELATQPDFSDFDPDEGAACVLRTFALPIVADL
jgi:hypothetical protein